MRSKKTQTYFSKSVSHQREREREREREIANETNPLLELVFLDAPLVVGAHLVRLHATLAYDLLDLDIYIHSENKKIYIHFT